MIRIKDWVIDADNYSFVVGKIKTRKGKGSEDVEYLAGAKYYATLGAAFESILMAERRNIVRENELTLAEAMERIERMQTEFRSLFAEKKLKEVQQ